MATVKRKRNLFLMIVTVIVAIMVLIALIPGAEKVVPAHVYEFASNFFGVATGVLIVIIGGMFIASSPVIGVALILIGAMMVWNNLKKRSE